MMDTNSAEKIMIEIGCVLVGMLGIGDYDKEDMRDGELETIFGGARLAHHQLLVSGLPCVHKNTFQNILVPAVNKLGALIGANLSIIGLLSIATKGRSTAFAIVTNRNCAGLAFRSSNGKTDN